MGGLMFFASHPSVYTLPGTWEPQPDIVYDPTLLLASGAACCPPLKEDFGS